MNTQTKFVTSKDGLKIFGKAVGNPQRPALVFIHGFGLSGVVFEGLFKNETLVSSYYLVYYDLRGFGKSGVPPDPDSFTSELFAADFAAVVEGFGLTKPLMIGWSYGASIASDICTHLGSDFVSGIVSVAGLPHFDPVTLNQIGKPFILSAIPGLTTTTDVNLHLKTKIAFIDSLFTHPDEVPDDLKSQWLGVATRFLPRTAELALGRVQDGTKLFEAGKAGLPWLVMYGTSDAHIKGDELVRIVKPRFTNSEVCRIEGGSHTLFYDDEEEFVSALVAFAKGVFRKGSM